MVLGVIRNKTEKGQRMCMLKEVNCTFNKVTREGLMRR